MGRLSDANANMLLDIAFSKATNNFPVTLYFGLSSTTPTNTGTNVTEPTGVGSYARVTVTNNATNFPAAAARSKSNGTVIVFNTCTSTWGAMTHWVAYDALTAGNFVAWGLLSASINVTSGTQASFAIGALVINAPGA
jgi:hypothetical protein